MTGFGQATLRYEGSIVADAYRLDSLLGMGSQGAVFRATELATGTAWALKLFHASSSRRLDREAKALLRLELPGVPPVHAYGTSGGRSYLVTELLVGTSLDRVLDAEPAPLSIAATQRVIRPLGETLDVAHARRLVHRDLKPSNVFLEASGGVRLLDFGYARIAEQSAITNEDVLPGSLAYIAPECLSTREIDGRADLYALGVLTYRCLAGVEPFAEGSDFDRLARAANGPRPTISARRPDLPPELDAFFARALAATPEERFGTAAELVSALAYCADLTDA